MVSSSVPDAVPLAKRPVMITWLVEGSLSTLLWKMTSIVKLPSAAMGTLYEPKRRLPP